MKRAVEPRTGSAPGGATQVPVVPSSPGELVFIGKDILELLSSAMYLDPLSIYREYVQNSADAIAEARSIGALAVDEPGSVSIDMDFDARQVIIRDNGAGIAADDAARRLLSIGASGKRGTRARGFRGIGRLAGLAYCRELVFRTRAMGDGDVVEVAWDCVRLRAALRATGDDDGLPGVIDKIVTVSRAPAAAEASAHFFEVELRDIVRHHRRDALLNEELVSEYLSEVAPVPFAGGFTFAVAIREHLAAHLDLPNLEIRINGSDPLVRPHQDVFPAKTNSEGHFSECELLTFEDRDGGVAAVGWLLHHEYFGAIPARARIGGLRLRAGDIQVGGDHVLEDYFPEPRFNGWTVAEVHVVDRRIIPNARRDNFEHNVHFNDLTAQLEPLARQIAKRCRNASIERNRLKGSEVSSAAVASAMHPSADEIPVELRVGLARCAERVRAAVLRVAGNERCVELEDALAELDAMIAMAGYQSGETGGGVSKRPA